MSCPYINSLDQECGRDAPSGHDGFCPFHHVLDLLDRATLENLRLHSWHATGATTPVLTRILVRLEELEGLR